MEQTVRTPPGEAARPTYAPVGWEVLERSRRAMWRRRLGRRFDPRGEFERIRLSELPCHVATEVVDAGPLRPTDHHSGELHRGLSLLQFKLTEVHPDRVWALHPLEVEHPVCQIRDSCADGCRDVLPGLVGRSERLGHAPQDAEYPSHYLRNGHVVTVRRRQ